MFSQFPRVVGLGDQLLSLGGVEFNIFAAGSGVGLATFFGIVDGVVAKTGTDAIPEGLQGIHHIKTSQVDGRNAGAAFLLRGVLRHQTTQLDPNLIQIDGCRRSGDSDRCYTGFEDGSQFGDSGGVVLSAMAMLVGREAGLLRGAS